MPHMSCVENFCHSQCFASILHKLWPADVCCCCCFEIQIFMARMAVSAEIGFATRQLPFAVYQKCTIQHYLRYKLWKYANILLLLRQVWPIKGLMANEKCQSCQQVLVSFFFLPPEIIEILLGVRGEFICHSHTLSYFFFLSCFPCPFPTHF